MQTSELRSGGEKGRHKTTHRQLIPFPGGGLLLDTPGMRELHLWTREAEADLGFTDIEVLAADCRYRDCTHESEPNCAVRAAVEKGLLPQVRLESYAKLRRETAFLSRKVDVHAELEEKRRWKHIAKHRRRFKGHKG